jgi:hypothetical protein
MKVKYMQLLLCDSVLLKSIYIFLQALSFPSHVSLIRILPYNADQQNAPLFNLV